MRRLSAKTFRLAAMTATSAAVAACGLSSAAPGNSLLTGPAGRPITVGISLPLGGSAESDPFSGDGQASKIGYELWASDVNSHGGLLGRPVRLKILDDKGSEQLTQANYRTLIATDHVDLTLAPFSSLLTIDAAKVTSRYGYALAAGSAAAPAVYALRLRSLFSTNVPVKNQMVPLARYVANLPIGQRPASAAYPMIDDPFADPPVNTARGILSRAGVRTVYAHPPFSATSSQAALARDAKAVARSGAQMVVLGSVDVPTVQAFVKQFVARHYNPKMFIAAAGPDQGQAFINAIGGPGNSVGIMVPNGWFGASPNALSHLMVQDYIAKYGGTASGINADVAESYSAGEVLAAAVAGTKGLSQRAIINWLHGHTVQTVVGEARFGDNGENLAAEPSALIFQWQPNEQFVQVLPAKTLGAKPIILVKPNWTG
ncbi:MAG: ABC transporter substrate-binding protein [Actinobacteria bacterium]|nr:ABC transporter substrate-binding protein [Actinomycetota bacterium]